MNPLYHSWKVADDKAVELHRKLKVHDWHARCFVTRFEGRKVQGWRVTVVRMLDGMTATAFVPDSALAKSAEVGGNS